VSTVIRVFARHGVALRRFGGCLDPLALATVANDPRHVTPKQHREAIAQQGHIICGLYGSSFGSKVTHLTFAGGRKGVTYTVLNVSCDIYPTSSTRYLDQDHALERIVRALSKEKNA